MCVSNNSYSFVHDKYLETFFIYKGHKLNDGSDIFHQRNEDWELDFSERGRFDRELY
jgi:hypothetical protein